MGLGNPMPAKKIKKKDPFGLGLNLVEKRVPKRAREWLVGTLLEEQPAKKKCEALGDDSALTFECSRLG